MRPYHSDVTREPARMSNSQKTCKFPAWLKAAEITRPGPTRKTGRRRTSSGARAACGPSAATAFARPALSASAPCAIDPQQGDQGLPCRHLGILAHRLAGLFGRRGHVQQVIGDLEDHAQVFGIGASAAARSVGRCAWPRIGPASQENSNSRAGLHWLVAQGDVLHPKAVHRAQTMSMIWPPIMPTSLPAGLGESRALRRAADLGVRRMGGGVGQDLRRRWSAGHRLPRPPSSSSKAILCVVGLAPAQIVIIHAGQVVMDQGIGVQHLDCRARPASDRESGGAPNSRRPHAATRKGRMPLAPGHHGIAHCFLHPGRRRAHGVCGSSRIQARRSTSLRGASAMAEPRMAVLTGCFLRVRQPDNARKSRS